LKTVAPIKRSGDQATMVHARKIRVVRSWGCPIVPGGQGWRTKGGVHPEIMEAAGGPRDRAIRRSGIKQRQ